MFRFLFPSALCSAFLSAAKSNYLFVLLLLLTLALRYSGHHKRASQERHTELAANVRGPAQAMSKKLCTGDRIGHVCM